MKKLLTLLFIFNGLYTAQAQTALKTSLWEKLPDKKGYINDYEHLFTDDESDKLTSMLSHFEIESSVAVTIVTISPDNTPKDRFEELTLHIAKQWGIGNEGKPNSILIGISAGFHRIRIQSGKGVIAVLSDQEIRNIVQIFFVPEFKENKYYMGTFNGITEIMRVLKERMKK